MEAQASPQITLPSSTEQAITVIKKYKNRKLYDTESSRYVTLKEEDVTVNILLLALAEKSKNQNRTEIASELDRMSKYLTK
jgi:PHB/PHA accumulation regulator DNA-binding domain